MTIRTVAGRLYREISAEVGERIIEHAWWAVGTVVGFLVLNGFPNGSLFIAQVVALGTGLGLAYFQALNNPLEEARSDIGSFEAFLYYAGYLALIEVAIGVVGLAIYWRSTFLALALGAGWIAGWFNWLIQLEAARERAEYERAREVSVAATVR